MLFENNFKKNNFPFQFFLVALNRAIFLFVIYTQAVKGLKCLIKTLALELK